MKKWLVGLLSIIFSFVFVACNSDDECKHEWQEATCTTRKTCIKCGEYDGSMLWHDYQGKCEEYGICSRCGAQSSYKFSHSYSGVCDDFGVCSKCGAISTEKMEHKFKGNIHTGELACTGCDKAVSKEEIRQKSVSQLTDEERAYIYWHLNRYLTATTSYGTYLYTTDEAFQMVYKEFYISVPYLKEDFWGVNSTYNHNNRGKRRISFL